MVLIKVNCFLVKSINIYSYPHAVPSEWLSAWMNGKLVRIQSVEESYSRMKKYCFLKRVKEVYENILQVHF